MLELSEPINVWTLFKESTIQPYLFYWKSRAIKIDSINLIHSTKDGSSIIYHFSVSSQGNFYRLAFNLSTLKWFLEAVEEGN